MGRVCLLPLAAVFGCRPETLDESSSTTENASTAASTDDTPGGDGATDASDDSQSSGTDAWDTSGTNGDAASEGSSTGANQPAQFPSDVLDVSAWKLQLPVGETDDDDEPWEVLPSELVGFVLDPWFTVDESGTAVRFRAHAGGVTTSNSGYPRSELREMTGDGDELASWSTTSGLHTMTISQKITHLPEVKAHVVAGQIHDGNDDLVMIRLEDQHLFVEGDGEELGTLDESYELGTEFTVRIVVQGGSINIYHDDLSTPAVTLERDATGCYFKAGAYVQSNVDRGDAPEAYGEVVIRELVVEHED